MRKAFTIARVIALLVTVLVIVALFISIERPQPALAQTIVTPQSLKLALIRAGLEPNALCAAGVSAQAVTTLVNNAETHLSQNPGALGSADSAVAEARVNFDSLEHLIQSGQASPEQVGQFGSSSSALANALAQRQTALNNIFGAATTSLSEDQKSILNTIRSNSGWEMPVEFRTINRAEIQWVSLREALANERISAASGEDPDPDSQTLLAQLGAEPTVAAAIANLQTNLMNVTTAWNSAIQE